MSKLVAVKDGHAVGAPSEAAAIFSMIERIAGQPEVPVERVEQLFKLYTQMDAERARRSFRSAFAKMQPALPAVERKGKSDKGKHARWEDIATLVMPVLQSHGFGLSFHLSEPAPKTLQVTCVLSHEDGHSEECSYPFPHDIGPGRNAIQAVGSAKTYGQRYTATALLGIATRDEDDDCKKAGGGELISPEQIAELENLLEATKADKAIFLQIGGVEALADISAAQFENAKGILLKKKAGASK